MAEAQKFHFLTDAEFNELQPSEKLEYLCRAMDALNVKAPGWSSLFSDPKHGPEPRPH